MKCPCSDIVFTSIENLGVVLKAGNMRILEAMVDGLQIVGGYPELHSECPASHDYIGRPFGNLNTQKGSWDSMSKFNYLQEAT